MKSSLVQRETEDSVPGAVLCIAAHVVNCTLEMLKKKIKKGIKVMKSVCCDFFFFQAV